MGPSHGPFLHLQFFNQSLAHLYPSPQGNFMNVHFGRYCGAFYYGGSRQGIKSAFCTFGAKCLAYGRCTKLANAEVSRPSPERARWEIFQASKSCNLGCNSLTILLFSIMAQRQCMNKWVWLDWPISQTLPTPHLLNE